MRTASPSVAILRAALFAAAISALEGSRPSTSIRVLRMLTVARLASEVRKAQRKVTVVDVIAALVTAGSPDACV